MLSFKHASTRAFQLSPVVNRHASNYTIQSSNTFQSDHTHNIPRSTNPISVGSTNPISVGCSRALTIRYILLGFIIQHASSPLAMWSPPKWILKCMGLMRFDSLRSLHRHNAACLTVTKQCLCKAPPTSRHLLSQANSGISFLNDAATSHALHSASIFKTAVIGFLQFSHTASPTHATTPHVILSLVSKHTAKFASHHISTGPWWTWVTSW
jgi:hypothetical protein